jgi:anti-sigma B factor antagonist
MDVPFQVHIERDERIVARGEIDMATVMDLTGAMAAMAGTGAPRVVLDLGEVTFIDSTGIGALVNQQHALALRGACLVIGSMSATVRTTLRLAGLESHFVEEAPGTRPIA